ncbi:hypothetical protein MMC24_004302 [Lignoscripta atroalba]|nr:hypothetical protein [Lignoscripta atroalba]
MQDFTDPGPGNGTNPGNGLTGEAIAPNKAIYMAIASFTAVAWYNVFELNIQVFMTFKRHRGLYFWSLIISSYGCVLHALGFLLKFFQLTDNDYLSVTIITIGWYSMVTGQAVVLYSRLHLVVRDQRVLRGVLIMIIVDAILFHIPTTVLTYGTNSHRSNRFTGPFNYVERIQMTAFCIQEFIISGIYVHSTIKLLRPVYHGRTRKVMLQLIWINLIIIGMDIVLLVMEYGGRYEIEATLKATVYSIKLKLEFAVLNQLMTLANSSVNNATSLTFNDEPPPPPPARKARSKSLNYLGQYIPYPKRSHRNPEPAFPDSGSPMTRCDSAATEVTRTSSLTTSTRGRTKWIPSLDRNCVIEAENLEKANDPHNIFTNPAACFQPNNSHRPNNRDSLTWSPTLSPTLTGSTLNHSNNNVSGISHHPGGRRAPPPPHLDLSAPPLGILRSNRPSVTDWANGPDGDSPNSSEARLDPYERAMSGLKRSGSVKNGRAMAKQSMGMDFMTSALHD